MNQNLLFVAKAIGDLKISINGEGCLGFSVNDVWTNFVTFEVMGDQGNLYPTNESGRCALENLRVLLSSMKLVPHGNDQTNTCHVTDNVINWFKTEVFTKIKEGFVQQRDVYKVVAQYREDDRTILSVTVEVMSNRHVQAILGIIARSQFITEIVQPVFRRDESGFYFIDKGIRYPLEGALLFKQCGVEHLTDALYYYRVNVNPNDTSLPTHILTKDKFDFQFPRGARILTV